MVPFRLAACIAIPILLGLSGCGPVHTDVRPETEDLGQVKRLILVVPDEGPFTVVLERAKATGAPAFWGGLIGAAVASSYNESQDAKTTDSLKAYLTGFSGRDRLLERLVKTLDGAGRFELITVRLDPPSGDLANHEAVLTVLIKTWGLRLVDRKPERLGGFVALEMKLVRGGRLRWDEHDIIAAPTQRDLLAYQQDGELLRRDIAQTLETAGHRVAMELLYPTGGPR
jgi:hypothetical protein